jgi:hypothetical protein
MGDVRKNGAIVVYDYGGNPLKRYSSPMPDQNHLRSAPIKAADASVLTEKLVITYESLESE